MTHRCSRLRRAFPTAILVAAALLLVARISAADVLSWADGYGFDMDEDGFDELCVIELPAEDREVTHLQGHIHFSLKASNQITLLIAIWGKEKSGDELDYLSISNGWVLSGDFDSRDHEFLAETEPIDLTKLQTGIRRLWTSERDPITQGLQYLPLNSTEIGVITEDGTRLTRQFDALAQPEYRAFQDCIDGILERSDFSSAVVTFDRDDDGKRDHCYIHGIALDRSDGQVFAQIWYFLREPDLVVMLVKVWAKEDTADGLVRVTIRQGWFAAGDFDSRVHGYRVSIEPLSPIDIKSRKQWTANRSVIDHSLRNVPWKPIEIGAITDSGKVISGRLEPLTIEDNRKFQACISEILQQADQPVSSSKEGG